MLKLEERVAKDIPESPHEPLSSFSALQSLWNGTDVHVQVVDDDEINRAPPEPNPGP